MSHAGQLAPLVPPFQQDFEALRRELAKAYAGPAEVIDAVLTALVAGGHVLLEGPPGVGKTLLVESLAQALGLTFHRISFTPDVSPADIIGTYVVLETAQGRRAFEFHEGPIFAHLILADHLNRGTPRAQAALLEALESPRLSVAGETFQLPQPFMVAATRNPQESEGAFPLPDAELDRFLLAIAVPLPGTEHLAVILQRATEPEPPALRPVIGGQRLLEMRGLVRMVALDAALRQWAIDLVAATDPASPRAVAAVRQYVRGGVGPRGLVALVLAGKTRALAAGRVEATAEDLRAVALPALRHRLLLSYEAQADGVTADEILAQLLAGQAVGVARP